MQCDAGPLYLLSTPFLSGGDDPSLLRREKMADHFEPAGTESLETVAGIQPVDDDQNIPVFTEEYVSALC